MPNGVPDGSGINVKFSTYLPSIEVFGDLFAAGFDTAGENSY